MALTRTQIETYLREVGVELESHGLIGEILLTGGAFMTLVLRSRNSTKDVDAVPISDAAPLRAAAASVAKRHSLPSDWLNDREGVHFQAARDQFMGRISWTPSV